jgi:hypothetical protein
MRLGIVVNLSSPTTDYYRSVNPFQRLRSQMKNLTVKYLNPETVKWYDFIDVDVLLFQRPNGDGMLSMIAEARKMGKKIILDHDDLLHEVNLANPASEHFGKTKVKESVEKAFMYADYLMVSTPFLKEFYKQFFDESKIMVIPNAIDFQVTPFVPVRKDKLETKQKRIIWRGSMTHIEDLKTVDTFWKAISKRKDTEVAFIGIPEWLGKTLYPNIKVLPWNNSLFQYFELIKNSAPHYGVFPLTIDNFNQAKSNNFAMEMLVAGCISYAPEEIKEFCIPSVRTYKHEADLSVKFAKAMEKDDAYFADLKIGREWLSNERDLITVNELRIKVLNSL